MLIVVGTGPKSSAVVAVLAMDRCSMSARTLRSGVTFAFDRESARRLDEDGHLHVGVTNISKANVCPYLGKEIPDWEALGLDPKKVYKLYRDPEELAKAAPTFNNKPLLSRHVEINANDHPEDLVIGSTGTDAGFAPPFLQNSLVVWKAGAIKDIESEAKKELSSAYRYRADMTPGTSPAGEPYDGVMRDMVGNHVALVKEGRAGADVVVGDSMENFLMAKKTSRMSPKALIAFGAIAHYLGAKMAKDEKIDLAPVLAGVTTKNFKDKKAGIAKSLTELTKGKLAADEGLEDVVALLDRLDGVKPAEDDIDANAGALPVENMEDTSMDEEDDGEKKRKEFLASKLSAEDMATFDSMFGPKAKDAEVEETPEQKAEREKKEKAAKDAEPKPFTEKAMDEKLKQVAADVRATERGIQEALRKVRPLVGELAVSFDSAEEVHRHVLKMKGVKGHDTMHADALPMALDMQIEKAAAGKRPAAEKTSIAADSAAAKSFSERLGGDHIRVI